MNYYEKSCGLLYGSALLRAAIEIRKYELKYSKENKMELKIEDLKSGDELMCIDRDGFNNSHRHNNTLTEFKVCKVGDLGVCINDGDWIIEIEELKYFKKKEQSQYTFDDLIDAAKKAVRDRVLHTFSFGRDLKERDLISLVSANNTKCIFDCKTSKEGVEFIQSLYKETFVIECEDDLKRVKSSPKITLNNGEVVPFTFKETAKDHLIFYDQACGHNLIPFVFLKGATVEQ